MGQKTFLQIKKYINHIVSAFSLQLSLENKDSCKIPKYFEIKYTTK